MRPGAKRVKKAPPSKKESGAQGRKRRAQEAATAARALLDAAGTADEWRKRYLKVGAPPKDTVGRTSWAGQIAALLIWEQLTAPELRSNAERKVFFEGVRTLGMTAVKSLFEQRLKRLEAMVYGDAEAKAAAARDDGEKAKGADAGEGDDGLEELPT